MDQKKLKALAAEFAKGIKTQADLNQLTQMLAKLTVETALNAEQLNTLVMRKIRPNQVLTHVMDIHQNSVNR